MHQPNNENESPREQNEDQKVAEEGPSRMEVIDLSDEDQELSFAEESIIEECLNDTEGSLSSVDLDFFAPSPTHKRSPKKHSIDKKDFDDDSSLQSISSMEDISDFVSTSNELPVLADLNINISYEELEKQLLGTIKSTGKEKNANEVRPRRSFAKAFTSVPKTSRPFTTKPIQRRVVRRKRRNSPPMKKYDKAHIYSFFSAIADLVVTFPSNQINKAEGNVISIINEMVRKVEGWKNDTSPNKPFRDAANDIKLLAIKFKLSKLELLHSFSKL